MREILCIILCIIWCADDVLIGDQGKGQEGHDRRRSQALERFEDVGASSNFAKWEINKSSMSTKSALLRTEWGQSLTCPSQHVYLRNVASSGWTLNWGYSANTNVTIVKECGLVLGPSSEAIIRGDQMLALLHRSPSSAQLYSWNSLPMLIRRGTIACDEWCTWPSCLRIEVSQPKWCKVHPNRRSPRQYMGLWKVLWPFHRTYGIQAPQWPQASDTITRYIKASQWLTLTNSAFLHATDEF